MDRFQLRMESIPRIFSFPLKVNVIGYLPVDFHDRASIYHNVDFSFRLSGNSEAAIIKTGGTEYVNKFPNALLNLPDVYYETHTPLAWETLYFSYDASVLPFVKQLKLDMYHPVWEFQLTADISDTIRKIFECSEKIHESGVSDKLDLLCYEMIIKTVFSSKNTSDIQDKNAIIVRKIASYIELHYAEDISLEKLIKKYSISRRTFFRYWKTIFELTPYDYIINLKIRAASFMLKNESMQIQEIADAVGFKDPFYFSRIFSRKTGISPLKYRTSNSIHAQ